MVTTQELIDAFPEFAQAPVALLRAKIALASERTDPDTWGTKWKAGVMQRAADLLAKTAEGRRMRLMVNDEKSIYDADLKTMIRSVTFGRGRVT